MDADNAQTPHLNGFSKAVWPSQTDIQTSTYPDYSDVRSSKKIPRTFSGDSGYFSQTDSGETLVHTPSENSRASLEEAEHFLASIRDTVPSILGADHLTSSPEEMAEEEAQSLVTINESGNIHIQEDINARESQIWEGTFDPSSSKRRKRSRSSSAYQDGFIQQKQKIRRLSITGNESEWTLLSQDLDWKAAESDACAFAAMSGRDRPGVITSNFDISEEVAQAANNWACRTDVFDPDARYLRITVRCCRKDICQWTSLANSTDRDKLSGLAATCKTTPSDENAWSSLPPACVILGDSSWSMYDLAKHVGPLEISGKLQPGRNSIQIALLGDTSDFLFIFYAEQPSTIEKMAAKLDHLREQKKKTFRDFLIRRLSSA